MNVPMPPRPPPADPRGSLGLGIALAWACLIAGYTICAFIVGAISSIDSHWGDSMIGLIVLIALLPWIAMVALIVWMASRGQSRTATGIGVGIASIFGVLLLLVAACFGILSSTNFH